ncbi:hypothetical protein DBV15_02261, partial [Temnothorax longispinosus]
MNSPHAASVSPIGSIYSPPLSNKFSLLSNECDTNINMNSGQISSAFKTLVITNRISTLLPVTAVTLATFPSQGHNSSLAKIKILQWNARGIQGKLPDLQSIAGKYDVICIQETLLTEGKNINVRGYNILRQDIVNPGLRGTCFVIKSTLKASLVQFPLVVHDSFEAAAISMPFQDDELIVFNIYRHPNDDTPA